MTSRDGQLVTAERLPTTEARFGMRALLVVSTVKSLDATGLGVLLRYVPSESRASLLIGWGVVGLVLLGCVVLVATRRRDVEQRAGMPRYSLPPHSYLFPNAPQLSSLAVGVTCLVLGAGYGLLLSIEVATDGIDQVKANVWPSIWAASACVAGIGFLWLNREVALCDDGVVIRYTLVPWSDNRRQYWDGCCRDVMVLEWQVHHRIAFHVPAELREQVETYVRERIAAAKSVAVRSGPSEAAAT